MLSVIVRALVNDTSSVNDQDGPRHASTSPSVRSDGASSEAADIVSTSIDNEMEGTMSNGPLADAPDLSLVDQIAQLALDRRVLDGKQLLASAHSPSSVFHCDNRAGALREAHEAE